MDTCHPDLGTQNRLGGRRSERHHVGVDRGEFAVQPWAARSHLTPVGLLVDPPPTTGSFPAEVLDRIGQKGGVTIDPGLLHGAVE